MQQVLEAIVSVFKQTNTQHLPEFAETTKAQVESPCDHICRTNPYLLAFSG